jgi:hypothetical protein
MLEDDPKQENTMQGGYWWAGRGEEKVRYVVADLLRCLRMTSTERPMTMPAAIDSQVKPGTAGMASGVVRLDEADVVTVTVLTGVEALLVNWLVVAELEVWEVEVLTWDELIDVELLVTELVAEKVLLTIEVEVDVVIVEEVLPPGGSRWRIKAKFGVGPDNTLLPTAKPFVPERRKTDVSLARVPVWK